MPGSLPSNRRAFLRTVLTVATVVPVAGAAALIARQAHGAGRPQAQDGHAFDYVNDAADAAGHAEFQQGRACENCAFWTGATADGWGSCAHPEFQDVQVNAGGWCATYVPGG